MILKIFDFSMIFRTMFSLLEIKSLDFEEIHNFSIFSVEID